MEYDNLDSFTRSRGLIKRSAGDPYARLLVSVAHRAGLVGGAEEPRPFDGSSVGYDFAVSEEWAATTSAVVGRPLGHRVLTIEYRRMDFRWTCARFGSRLPVVLRDRALSPRGVRAWC